MNYNRIILIGRLATDPELKYTPSGIAVTQFRLAVNRPLSAEARQQGGQEQADFIDIAAWRQSAEYAANNLSKGRLVLVEGRLQIREYQKQDGTRAKAAEVVADNIKGLDRRTEGEGGGDAYAGGGGNAYGGGGNSYNGGGGGGRSEYDQRPAPQQQAAPQQRGAYGGGNAAPAARPASGGNRNAPPQNEYNDMDDFNDPFAE